MPKYFSNSYRSIEYWETHPNNLEPPEKPDHSQRIINFDPLPRLVRNKKAITRHLVTEPVRIQLPLPQYHFCFSTITRHHKALPRGVHQAFRPAGPGTWEDLYQFYNIYSSVPTYRNPWQRNPIQSESYWS